MTKALETLSGADAEAFKVAISPFLLAVLDENNFKSADYIDVAIAAAEATLAALVSSAQDWAEGTLPGGAGTKSSKEWSIVSGAFAARALNALPFLSWTGGLAAATDMADGDRAVVFSIDTGTHVDPVVGGVVPNSGLFTYSAAPAGWQRVASLDSDLAHAWAEGTLPGGAGTKSAKEWANLLANQVLDFASNPARVPLYRDDAGDVPLWLENGMLAAYGLSATLISAIVAQVGLDTSPPLSNKRVPLFKDDAGDVPLWLDNGLLDAIGLGPTVLAAVQTAMASLIEPRSTPTAATLSTRVERRGLSSWRAKIASILQGGTGVATLVISGDSWAEKPTIPAQFASILHAKYGSAGNGYISVADSVSGQTHHNAAVTMTRANWTDFDASTGAAVPAFGCSIDGQAISTTGSTATLSLTGWTDTDAKIFYSQYGTGSFRYRIDGGAWTTVTATGAGGLGVVTLGALGAGAHTLDIDTSVNAGGGTVALFGFNLWKSAGVGVLIHKVGNVGLTGSNLAGYVGTYITPIANHLQPDAVVQIMSTNDYRFGGNTPANLTTQYGTLVASYRAAKADTGFVFVAPAQSNGGVVTPQSQYRDAIASFCLANGHAFYNMHDLWDTYAVENPRGQWAADGTGLHVSIIGGYRLAAGIERDALSF